MSGNTKLIGFGTKNRVLLKRWGKSHDVELSPDSLAALRGACHALPQEPVAKPPGRNLFVKYQEEMGRVSITSDPNDDLEGLAMYLQRCSTGNTALDTAANKLGSDLASAIQEHHDYLSTDGEPGVK